MLEIVFFLYGMLTVLHVSLQMRLANDEHRRQVKANKERDWRVPSISKLAVIVPVYNEDPKMLDKCLDSILVAARNTGYLNVGSIKVVVVDDGSKNREELEREVYSHYDRISGFFILKQPNKGKRQAQANAIKSILSDRIDIVVTVDSDTVLEKYALSQIVKRFEDKNVGAVTGSVLALNKAENFLTQLIHYRYWMAFNQERAAQSFFEVLMCCSGPFSAYRMSILQKVLDRYTNQKFLGKLCTYGDDRHLTNLVLEEGWKVVYHSEALSTTVVPNTLLGYIKQQVRWNKSFYREMLWTLKSIKKHHWFLIYELSMQFILPLLLVFALIHAVAVSVETPKMALMYILIILAMSIFRVGYGIYRTRDFGFLRFLVYSLLHIFVLIPVRIYAIVTIADRRWGTR